MPLPYNFPRQLRLTKAREFHHVFQKAIKKQNNGILVFARENACDYPRLGLIIAKREVPKAVKRNLFKRLIRESFRFHQGELTGFDIIVMVKRRCLELSNTEINHYLEQLWARVATS